VRSASPDCVVQPRWTKAKCEGRLDMWIMFLSMFLFVVVFMFMFLFLFLFSSLFMAGEGRLGPVPGVTRNAYAHQPGPTSSSGEGCATRRAVGLPAERESVSVASYVCLELPTAHATMDDCTWGGRE
jgi:hypothetical protein